MTTPNRLFGFRCVPVERDGGHHGVPVTPEIARDLLYGTTVPANLESRQTRCPGFQRALRRRDQQFLRSPRCSTRRAPRSPLLSNQPGQTPEHRQIHEHHLAMPMSVSRDLETAWHQSNVGADHLDTKPMRPLTDSQHGGVGQAHRQCAHAHGSVYEQGLHKTRPWKTSLRLARPLSCVRDPSPRHQSHPQIRSASNRQTSICAPEPGSATSSDPRRHSP